MYNIDTRAAANIVDCHISACDMRVALEVAKRGVLNAIKEALQSDIFTNDVKVAYSCIADEVSEMDLSIIYRDEVDLPF